MIAQVTKEIDSQTLALKETDAKASKNHCGITGFLQDMSSV